MSQTNQLVEKTSFQIIEIKNGVPVVSHKKIAQLSEVEDRSVRLLIDKHLADLEEFGGVTFEMTPLKTNGGTQKVKIYYLNESQATLLITYLQNTQPVRSFKKALIKEFYLLKSQREELERNFKVGIKQYKALEEKKQEIERKYYEQLEITNRLLLEKLDSNDSSKKPKVVHWTEEEEQQLLSLVSLDYSIKDIAKKLNRGVGSVRSRIHQLKSKGKL